MPLDIELYILYRNNNDMPKPSDSGLTFSRNKVDIRRSVLNFNHREIAFNFAFNLSVVQNKNVKTAAGVILFIKLSIQQKCRPQTGLKKVA